MIGGEKPGMCDGHCVDVALELKLSNMHLCRNNSGVKRCTVPVQDDPDMGCLSLDRFVLVNCTTLALSCGAHRQTASGQA